MESKLGAILNNPDMMAQIMSMAQQFSGGESPPPPPPEPTPSLPEGLDMGMLMKIAGMANSASVDKDQRALLLALRPYLTTDRIGRLEKAMRASKLAGLASSFLGSGILSKISR
ncbi:MAG: hypothetical protein E7455_00580 [Ruminococcaceae bacterium]|nr:hypothetical protein [Oscillospiraceae bacterium]